jgi:transglutaminase-like putative cysteine protease
MTRRHDAFGNVALALLSLAAAVDLARLFRTVWTFLGPVALCVIAVHAVCWSCRRRGLGLGLAAAVSTWVVVLLLTWTVFPSTSYYGLPVRATFRAAGHALSMAMQDFRTAAPPAPVTHGFILAGAIGAGAAAFLADWAAFRLRATIEACLPSLSLFVFSAALAQGHRTTLAAAVWLGGLLLFLLSREAGPAGPAWFASRSARGREALLRVGAGLAAVVVVLAALIGPHLPGATATPLVDWRHGTGGGGRSIASPLVDIRSRLTQESDVEVFTVAASQAAYWRLTSLDNFEGTGWSLNDTYEHAHSTLGPAPPGTTIAANVAVTNLESIWLPAPYRPVRYSGPGHVSYSPSAASLVADRSTSDGLSYDVVSVDPTPSAAVLRRAPPAAGTGALARDLSLPALPTEVIATAHSVTAGASTPYDEALLLQNFFRTQFTYDLNVPADDGENAIVAFLRSRRGFCQQFAGTYAVMARALGLPSRVAVGFTPGILQSDGRYHVEDLHAHAWPEVYFTGVGWVAFEPTPGRGIPGAQGYTGVPPQQASPSGTTEVPATPSSVPRATTTPTTVASAPAAKRPTPTSRHRRSPLRVAGIVALWCLPVLLIALTPAVTSVRRRRRRLAASTPEQRILLAWDESSEQLALVGCGRQSWDTPAEFAHRVNASSAIAEAGVMAVGTLARHVEAVSYAPHATVDETVVADAEEAATTVSRAVAALRTHRQRVAQALDPRQLIRRS